MTKKILFGIFTLIWIFSCSKNDDSNQVQTETINGSWTALKFECGACMTQEFEVGDIIWDFNLSDNTVEMSEGTQNLFSLSGNYDIIPNYEIDLMFFEDWSKMKIIDGFLWGISSHDIYFYKFEEEKLLFMGGTSETPVIEFIRYIEE